MASQVQPEFLKTVNRQEPGDMSRVGRVHLTYKINDEVRLQSFSLSNRSRKYLYFMKPPAYVPVRITVLTSTELN